MNLRHSIIQIHSLLTIGALFIIAFSILKETGSNIHSKMADVMIRLYYSMVLGFLVLFAFIISKAIDLLRELPQKIEFYSLILLNAQRSIMLAIGLFVMFYGMFRFWIGYKFDSRFRKFVDKKYPKFFSKWIKKMDEKAIRI